MTLVTTILDRYFAQNGRAAAPAAAGPMAFRLFGLIGEHGLPPPLAAGECGKPGGMSDEACAPLVARVVATSEDELLAEAARQLVKACFYPEFTVCRDSYRMPDAAGRCRRQELARVRRRVSGSHCIDCPYWVSLDEAAHRDLLTAAWSGDGRERAGHWGIFLPADFRRLRRWLHARARDARRGGGDGAADNPQV